MFQKPDRKCNIRQTKSGEKSSCGSIVNTKYGIKGAMLFRSMSHFLISVRKIETNRCTTIENTKCFGGKSEFSVDVWLGGLRTNGCGCLEAKRLVCIYINQPDIPDVRSTSVDIPGPISFLR